jgi:hypothetical protein
MAEGSTAAPDADVAATLAAWRERGAHRHDPVRFHVIEAMARRAAAHQGEARRVIEARLAELVAAYRESIGKAGQAAATPDNATQRSPLSALVDALGRPATPHEGRGAAPAAPPELKTLSRFRSTWARLSADQRLTRSFAKVPENAGPLNSHHLVHRSLTLMRDLSPEYLQRFLSYVDTLQWLDQANGGAVFEVKDVARGKGR